MMQNNQSFDDIDRALLKMLTQDARMSLKELAQRVGLSSPSTAERMRKLEASGVIRGYTAVLEPAALGYSFEAIVRIRPLPGKLHSVEQLIADTAAVVVCDKVTGDDCFIARLVLRSMAELDQLLDKIAAKATTNTSIVKSRTVAQRPPPV